jgi:hydroxymethylglutaryl-CoA synthase
MLVDGDAELLEVDLAVSGSDSEYRMVDFRKPFARFHQPPRDDGQIQDLPVFNGRYSTSCYIDATHHAMEAMLAKRVARRGDGYRPVDYFDEVDAVFMHRPYHRMPATGWVMAYLFELAADDAGREQLRAHCGDAGIDADALLAELTAPSPFRGHGVTVGEDTEDVFPLAKALRQHLRKTPLWAALVGVKLGLGSEAMRDLGNLYTAALPAWLASGLRQAVDDELDITGQEWLALGYGSGDAAEALPMRVAAGWRDAAAHINFAEALGTPTDLSEADYLALHEGRSSEVQATPAYDEFVVDHVGTLDGPKFQDLGIEYYRFVGPAARD